ncbi:unnamed protein product [Lathyrus sativus]|nr:unnamed protein product [Lathyrus sativus]
MNTNVATMTTNVVVTPKEDHEKKNEEDNGDNWTLVNKATRDKGKKIVFLGSTSVVNCMNGFEALRVLNDPLVTLDIGPC